MEKGRASVIEERGMKVVGRLRIEKREIAGAGAGVIGRGRLNAKSPAGMGGWCLRIPLLESREAPGGDALEVALVELQVAVDATPTRRVALQIRRHLSRHRAIRASRSATRHDSGRIAVSPV